MRRRRVLGTGAGACVLFTGAGVVWRPAAASGVAPRVIDLQGHRGARGLRPENTLPAFALALELGVSTLELDVGVSRDGVVVVSHDPLLNPDLTRGPDGRWLDGPGPVVAYTDWAELRHYDVGRARPGSRTAQQFPQQQPADGTPLARLAEVFDLVRARGAAEVRLSIETKISPLRPELTLPPEAFARAVVAEIRRAGMAARSTVQSFDWRTLQLVQALAPEIGTVYLSVQRRGFDTIGAGQPQASPWTAGLRHDDHGSVPHMVRAAGGRLWSAHHADLSTEVVAQAHNLGLTVLTWTVNDPADIDRALDLGVDGVITDHPERARAALQRRGWPLPPARPRS
jgi:glycerophosphoryl diester phosphodiesterase